MAFVGRATIKMQGLEQAKARLRAAVPTITKAASDQLAVEAKALAEEIRAKVPVRTGALKGSVEAVQISNTEWEIRAGGDATTKKIRAGVRDRDFAQARVAGNNKGEFDYARGVEFGHRTPEGKHVPAEPFFYPPYRARRAGIRKRVLARVIKAANDTDLT